MLEKGAEEGAGLVGSEIDEGVNAGGGEKLDGGQSAEFAPVRTVGGDA